MSSLHAELLVYANSTNNEAAWSLYEYCFDSKLNQTKLPDILGCQAEARRLLSPLLMSVFKDYLVHKPLFTNSFCSVTEILPRSGAATEATWRFACYSRQIKTRLVKRDQYTWSMHKRRHSEIPLAQITG